MRGLPLRRGLAWLALFLVLPAWAAKSRTHDPDQRPNQVHYDPALYGPERPLGELIAEQGLNLVEGRLAEARLVVNKARRRLELFSGEKLIKAYRVQLSRRAEGTKERRSDMRTPEGDYRICGRHPASKYHRGLVLSYPGPQDADRGLAAKRLTSAQHAAVLAAHAQGRCPPMNTKLGGWIMLHGQDPQVTRLVRQYQEQGKVKSRRGGEPGDRDPATLRKHYDWTLGCVALLNPDMRELFDFLAIGTPVTIVPDGTPALPPGPSSRSGKP